MSVLWLTGAPGVGKSTVGWALYTRARMGGRPVAYVDIDQLGLLVPAPTADPEYHRLKATNLVEVVDVFRCHGAQQVIVSGVVDPHRGIDPYVRGAKEIEFTLIRLHCGREELRRRYLERGAANERVDEVLAVADALDRSGVGSPLDTTTMSLDEVVETLSDRIRPATQSHPVSPASKSVQPVPEKRAAILLLAGPTAVGKSTVGWEVLQILRGRGIPAAFIDVDQLGFYGSGLAPDIKADNLVRVWRGYRGAGARVLVLVARGVPHRYQQLLSHELVTTAYLAASPSELADRIARRGRGQGPGLAGDSLIEASAWQQSRTATRATEETTALRQHRGTALIVDTDHATSSAVAAELADLFPSGILT
ncbi:AAA family ATPase [Nocardia sp. NPDC051570]|uniref:AAA family ATPase n=1 Tax=Nocardia sp. NPDC051570 TaxID=3364324 RepID=UPI003790737D